MQTDLWTYEITLPEMPDLTRFEIEATDGSIGHVDEASYDVGASYLVVDTGPWIFGKKVLLPASVIRRVDLDAKKVHLGLTKDQIKSAPEFDEKTYMSKEYRDQIGTYYGTMV